LKLNVTLHISIQTPSKNQSSQVFKNNLKHQQLAHFYTGKNKILHIWFLHLHLCIMK